MRLYPALAVLAVFALTSCQTINLSDPALKGSGGDSSATASSKSSDAKKPESPFKPWDEVLKDTRAMEGQFNVHLKRDQTLFMEIQPGQIGEDFGFISHYSKGTGVFGLHDGLALTFETRIMRFRRVGDTIYLVHVNMRFTADEGSPMKNSLDDNVGNSIVGAFPIASQNDSTKALLVDITGFVVSDYMKIGNRIKPYFSNRPVQFVKGSSYVEKVQVFPGNVEIDALLTYKPNGNSTTTSAGVSDIASVPVGVRYSFFALPENPMTPRLADDRVGYFLDSQRDFSNDKNPDQMIRYINRWRLEKADPTADVSDPVKPIVYYVDRSVPHEYRQWIREGIEGWQRAFEAAGISNAIIAMDAPDDSTWSAEDMRYSTVRWSAAHEMNFAIGPSETDPRTGEILNADILLSSIFMLGWTNSWQNLVGENGMLTRMQEQREKIELLSPYEREQICLIDIGKQEQMGLLQTVLLADGLLNAAGEVPPEFYGPMLRHLVFHEVGHTLGLRHNFRASASIPYDRLQDKDYTAENGISISVMDYDGININPDRDNQGHYVSEVVGTYDIWAINYGYSQAPEEADDAVFAEAIARQSANPKHAYNTDGDVRGGPYSIDPLTNSRDLSSDPMAYATDQMQLVDQIVPVLEDRMVKDGDSFSKLRASMNGMMFTRYRQLDNITKMVGGSYFSRDHKGDPNGRVPFTPVSAADQRQAVDFVLSNVLDTSSFPFNADMLNKAAPSRNDDWNESVSRPFDPAMHEAVLSLQMGRLSTLLDRIRMRRMINTQLRTDDPYTVSELMETTTDAVYASLGKNSISSFDRNLQIAYLDYLGGLMNNLRPRPSSPSAPAEAQALARLELTELQADIETTQGSGSKDRVTTAHLMALEAKVDATFDIDIVREVK